MSTRELVAFIVALAVIARVIYVQYPRQSRIVSYGPELPEKLERAMALLNRTADALSDNPPDKGWFRDYFLLTGEHMILTDEGWQPPSAAQYYLEEDSEWEPDDEVNAPERAR